MNEEVLIGSHCCFATYVRKVMTLISVGDYQRGEPFLVPSRSCTIELDASDSYSDSIGNANNVKLKVNKPLNDSPWDTILRHQLLLSLWSHSEYTTFTNPLKWYRPFRWHKGTTMTISMHPAGVEFDNPFVCVTCLPASWVLLLLLLPLLDLFLLLMLRIHQLITAWWRKEKANLIPQGPYCICIHWQSFVAQSNKFRNLPERFWWYPERHRLFRNERDTSNSSVRL